MATFYLDLGALYGALPDYIKSLEATQMVINLYNELGSKNDLAACYMNVGILYRNLHQPAKALEYMQKAMQNFLTVNKGIDYGVVLAYEGMANVYMEASDQDLMEMGIDPRKRNATCMELLNKALAVAQALNENTLIGSVNEDMGLVQENMSNADAALQHYQKASECIKKERNQEHLSNIYFSWAIFTVTTKIWLRGSITLTRAYRWAGRPTGFTADLQKMSSIYEKVGRFDTALVLYKDYITIRDSIYNKEKEKEITRKQMQIDFAVKENDYKLTQQIADGKIKQQLLLAKQQQLQLVNKEKDLQRLMYLQKQAALQNEQQLQASLLQKNTVQSKYDKEM
jgi:tetratricopeptide (TPR) repeat protein